MAKKHDLKIKAVLAGVDEASKPLNAAFSKITVSSKKATATIERGVKKIGQGGLKIAKIAAAGAAALAASSAAALKYTADWAGKNDEMIKFSRQIGFSVESVQELDYAAGQQGVGADTLRKSLEKMNVVVGQLRVGQGALASFLQRTDRGLLRQIKSAKSNEEVFDLVIKKLIDIPAPAQKAAFAMAAFGKSGTKMVRLVEGGIENLSDLREEARKFGIVVSKETAENSEVMGDELDRLQRSIQGIKNDILSRLLPVINPIITKTWQWVIANREVFAAGLQSQIDKTINKIKEIHGWWEANRTSVIKFGREAFDALKGTISVLNSAFSFLRENSQIILGVIKKIALFYLPVKIITGIAAVTTAVNTQLIPSVISLGGVFKAIATNPYFLAITAAIASAYALAEEFDRAGKAKMEKAARKTGTYLTTSEDEAKRSGMMAARRASLQARSGRALSEAAQVPKNIDVFGESSESLEKRWAALRERFPPPQKVGGEIVVKFENAPPGMELAEVSTPANQGVSLSANVGFSAVGGVAL